MQVAFWSTVHGQSATTTNMISIALMVALEYRFKLLITHNHHTKSTLETSLLDESYLDQKITDLNDTGIDALGRFVRFNAVDSDAIENYTLSLIKNRLDILTGTKNINKELYVRDFNMVLEAVFESAAKCYDLVLIDTTSGENKLSEKVLENADMIVVCLNQNTHVLDDYFNNVDDLIKQKAFYLIGLYDSDSKYNIATLRRKYRIKENNIAGIPYCRELADASNEGQVIDFFLRNIDSDKSDMNFYFIEGVRQSVNLILKRMGYDTKIRRIDS